MKFLSARSLSLLLIVVGLLVSGYLSYLKMANEQSLCLSGGMLNCEAVLNSRFSEVNLLGGRVPIAYLGWSVYALLLAMWLWQGRSAAPQAPLALFFGINAFAWLYSMYLVYLQFFVLRAACQWCLTHEANITLLFGVTLYQLRSELRRAAYS